MSDVKICGITDQEALSAAINGGARFVGFVFYPPSPRNLSLEDAAALAEKVPSGVYKVGLFVDPSDEELDTVLKQVPLDMIQLHGHESPGRVAEIKQKTGVQIIKAIQVGSREDLDFVPGYEACADWLMFDAKPDKQISGLSDDQNQKERDHPIIRSSDHPLPGGRGKKFDWSVLEGFSSSRPWFLAGGLTPDNVQSALDVLEPDAVDVSSGVESAPGHKDPEKIKTFLEAVSDF